MLFPKLTELLDPEPHSAPMNMALDEALLRTVETPTLRVYRWQSPALSFGYFGKIADVETEAMGREMVRRWTGGGIVAHGADVTYTLLIPRRHPLCEIRPFDSYRRIHEAIAGLLTSLGKEAAIVPTASAKISEACFANPARHDVLVAGEKIAGAAQRRTRWGLLHQGSIQGSSLPERLGENLGSAFASAVQRRKIAPSLEAAARQLAHEKYGTSAWLRKF